MSLKDLTADKHKEAENTNFMKAVFARTLPMSLWADWTYQKWLFYHTIEGAAGSCQLLTDLPDIRRAFYLFQDYQEMTDKQLLYKFRKPTIDYHYYLLDIAKEPNKVMAHLYTWHMGDMFGGQMIKKIIQAPHRNLEFKDSKTLITNIRAKLTDDMADEANKAFEWAILMMRDYDRSLG